MVVEISDIDDKIKYVIDVILKEAKLEDLMVKQSLYAMLSAYTNNALNVKVEAPTGEGKNWVLGKVSDLFPKEDVFNLAGMTDKALYHKVGKMVIKNERDGEYEDAEEILKARKKELKKAKRDLDSCVNKADRLQLESQIETIEDELEDMKKNLLKMILLSNKIFMYLDTPRQGLINNMMSMLSHDEYELEYDFVDTSNGIKTKANILRGWPAFFYAQAADTSHYKRDAETSRRFVKVNPTMTKEKYQAAAKLIAQKWGMPDFMYQATVVSDAEKDRAREIIRGIKENLISISGAIKPGSNNVIAPFSIAITERLDTSNAKDVNTVKRLFAWLSLLPVIKLEKRPRMIVRREGQLIREVMPFALMEDLREAIELMEFTSGVRPYLVTWFDEVFTTTFNNKTEADSKVVDGIPKEEDRIAVTTKELVAATKDIQGKILTAQQVYQTYLRPLINAGHIDSQRSNIHGRDHIYWLTGLKPKDDNSLITSILGQKMINDDDASSNKLANFTLKSCTDYIQKVVSSSSSGCIFCEIFDHEGNQITVDQLVEKYYHFSPKAENNTLSESGNNAGYKGSDDDQETGAKSGSVGQAGAIRALHDAENEKNDQRSTSLWKCPNCTYQTDNGKDYYNHAATKHPNRASYSPANPNGSQVE